MTRVVAACAVAMLITACGGDNRSADGADRYREHLNDQNPMHNNDTLVDLAVEACEMDDDTFAFAAALSADRGSTQFRVGVEHVCPDRVREVDAVEELGGR